jgi:hypothetical protein
MAIVTRFRSAFIRDFPLTLHRRSAGVDGNPFCEGNPDPE